MPDTNQGAGGTQGAGGNQQGQGQGGTQGQGQQQNQQNQQPASFEEWAQAQPAEVQDLINGHIQGLRNTVQATRSERDALSTQLQQLQQALGKNPDEAKRLVEQMQQNVEAANRRASFVEEAVRAEIGCTNPKAAYALAVADNLFTRKGDPDWAALKAAAPELFGGARTTATRGDAGAGTGNGQPRGGMNDFIRTMARGR